jgi:hypothetical protein
MAENGRGEHGRFAKGWKGGTGRPPRALEMDYLRAMSDRCTPEIWGEIVDRAVEGARVGDSKDRAWLSSYLLGTPQATAPSLFTLKVADDGFVEASRALNGPLLHKNPVLDGISGRDD